ncbi:MAG TPA: hypothetical protein VKV69_03365, partial [Actinomycetota bacterium]|nr:hypothetical protein [Actinomycetota bacterium]
MKGKRLVAFITSGLLTLVACSAGTTVVARSIGGGPPVVPGPTETGAVLSKGGLRGYNVGAA